MKLRGSICVKVGINSLIYSTEGLPRWLMVENPPANAGAEGDVDSTPGSGRSPGGGNGKSTPIILPEKSQG